jgi:L-2-hydroxyglutarate oxidase
MPGSRTFDVAVAGGGIVGLAVARALARECALRVVLFEAEPALAFHQTGHNSGVIHSGLYYRPGSLKARLCAEGREAMFDFAAGCGIAHERCGKVVVATREEEVVRLDELERRGRANGLAGIERLDAAAIRAHEPEAAGVAGLFVAETGIVDYRAVAAAFAADIASARGELRCGTRVDRARSTDGEVAIESGGESIRCGFFVACAGLQSDRLARRSGLATDVRIVPFRGDYYELEPAGRARVRNLIYPVPDPELPFLGVHLTRRVDGSVEAGPNAVLAWKREGYSRASFSLADAATTLAHPGFWKMAPRHAPIAWSEYRRAWSRRRFLASLRELVPSLDASEIRRGGCGIRAQAVDGAGKLLDDFAFAEGERQLHVLNAPSPGATASIAIGRYLAGRVVAAL